MFEWNKNAKKKEDNFRKTFSFMRGYWWQNNLHIWGLGYCIFHNQLPLFWSSLQGIGENILVKTKIKQREEKEWKESLFKFLSWQLLVSSLTISIQSSELDWENHIVALFVGILFRGSNSSRDHEWFELLVNLFSRFLWFLTSISRLIKTCSSTVQNGRKEKTENYWTIYLIESIEYRVWKN